MEHFWEKVEHYNAKLIPYALVILLGIIIFELFIHVEDEQILLLVHGLDWIVISIFVIDLIFLSKKTKSAKEFFKHYWLDLLAVFPFALLFSLVGRIYQALAATEQLAVGQAIFHESLEAEKGLKAVARGEKTIKFARAARFIRIGARILRVITKSHLFSVWSKKSQSQQSCGAFLKNDIGIFTPRNGQSKVAAELRGMDPFLRNHRKRRK
ncbi:hypothetical protein HYT55_01270 [Candidatus Woesearchaeota archaeon]|nr:hypothetical protein [Candidatus Woesearchaeota archaeon]